jgi:hypothetical protein
MTLTAFVSTSNGNANKPGAAQRLVRLNHVKAAPATPAIPATATTPAVPASTPVGPNDALFDNPSAGDVTINFSGINEATKNLFQEGKTYSVTIVETTA